MSINTIEMCMDLQKFQSLFLFIGILLQSREYVLHAIENWRSSLPAELEESEVCWWSPILPLVSLHFSYNCQADEEARL